MLRNILKMFVRVKLKTEMNHPEVEYVRLKIFCKISEKYKKKSL